MAWNEPSGNGSDKKPDPWGNDKKNQNPPDLDKLIGQFIKKIQDMLKFGPKKPSNPNNNTSWQPTNPKEYGYGVGLVALVIFVAWFVSGFFIVNPAEQTVILRFGQFAETVNPGMHWMARFIDTKYTVDVQKIYSFSLESDVLTKSSEQSDLPNQYLSDKSLPDSSDRSKNVVNVELNVQYRIVDPRAYLFNVVNPDDTIKQVAAGALSEVIGKMKLDEVLTTGRELLSSGVMAKIKSLLTNYNSGLDVIAVTLRKVQAPDQVKAAFNDVNRADQDKATYIQQAQAYASKVVPLAQGVAARILADANAYKQQVSLGAQAQIAKYQALLSVYQTSPDLTRERMYLETLQSVFENTTKILIDVNGSNNMLYLPLDKIMQREQKVEPEEVNNEVSAGTSYSNLNVSALNGVNSHLDSPLLGTSELKA
jgi:membrane protease subunit HflK